jgi:hypothetical protein
MYSEQRNIFHLKFKYERYCKFTMFLAGTPIPTASRSEVQVIEPLLRFLINYVSKKRRPTNKLRNFEISKTQSQTYESRSLKNLL